MAQFDVHQNPNSLSAKNVPFLLDVQSNLLSSLATRVVVPLVRLEAIDHKPAQSLSPVFAIEGEKFVMLTPEIAGIPLRRLGQVLASLSERRADIVRALDIVFSGV